jgi:hypothetical protein
MNVFLKCIQTQLQTQKQVASKSYQNDEGLFIFKNNVVIKKIKELN